MSDKDIKRYVADIGIGVIASSATWIHHGSSIQGTIVLFVGIGAVLYGNLTGGDNDER